MIKREKTQKWRLASLAASGGGGGDLHSFYHQLTSNHTLYFTALSQLWL